MATGALARFAALMHTAPLRGLLCFATAYVFMLTRQRSGPLAGCWMTDAVLRL